MYCIEEYKTEKNLSGKEIMRLFREYSVCEYNKSFYEALHTTDKKNMVEYRFVYQIRGVILVQFREVGMY